MVVQLYASHQNGRHVHAQEEEEVQKKKDGWVMEVLCSFVIYVRRSTALLLHLLPKVLQLCEQLGMCFEFLSCMTSGHFFHQIKGWQKFLAFF